MNMLENSPKFHTLDIEYNGLGPFTVACNTRPGISVSLVAYTGTGTIALYISYRIDRNTSKHFTLNNLQPGDRLKFTYDGPNVDSGTSIERIEEHDPPAPFKLREGFRFGFDVIEGDKRTRISHPEGGGLNLMIANAPRDHARVWTQAGNDQESWNWQHPDLYAGDAFEIEIVETDWCDPFPNIEKRLL